MADDPAKSLLKRSKTIPKAINCSQQLVPVTRKHMASNTLSSKALAKTCFKPRAKALTRSKSSCIKLVYTTERRALMLGVANTQSALLPYLKALAKGSEVVEQVADVGRKRCRCSKSTAMLCRTQYKSFVKVKPMTSNVYKLSQRIYFSRRSKLLNSKLIIISFEGVVGDYFPVSFWRPETCSLHLRKEALTSLQRLSKKYQVALWLNSPTKAQKLLQYILRNTTIDAAYVFLGDSSKGSQMNYEQIYEDFQVSGNVEKRTLVVAAYQCELVEDADHVHVAHKMYSNEVLSRHIPLVTTKAKYKMAPIVILVQDLRMSEEEVPFSKIEEVIYMLGTTFETSFEKHKRATASEVLFVETDAVFQKFKEKIEVMKRLYRRRVSNNRRRILDRKCISKCKRKDTLSSSKYIELLKINQRIKGRFGDYPISHTAKFNVDNGDMDLATCNTIHRLIILRGNSST